MERVKLGIIGLGLAWERLHAPALSRLQDRYEIVAVCDADGAKAKSVAQFLGLAEDSWYYDYNKMLARKDIEAVESLVPISGNYEAAEAVIRSGKHLIAEKPLASTLEAAQELIKLRDKKKVQVMVAENVRYEEQNILLKNLITGGHIGNPIYFIDNHVVEYRQESERGGFGQTDWRQHPDFKGGVIMDSGVHHVARMRFLFGDATSVFAHGRPSEIDFAPYSCINGLLQFPGNVMGHYAFLLIGKETQAPLVGLRIFGTHGEIYLEEPNCGYVNVTYKENTNSTAISYNPGQGYFLELENFHAALRHGAKIESTPEKALGDIATVFAIIESARLSEAVNPKNVGKISQSYILPKVTSYPGARTAAKMNT
ncbi:MAG: Gfo/Idh/MocA family oxidoreductase [Clostridiales bacterium]|nr:Gfo/Idh/MocA family oxidoreductase [Clostridiales bacterium]